MNLSQLAFRFRPVLYLTTAIAILYGVVSYFALPTREDPEITIRQAVISTSYPGLTAEQVEENITKPLEASVRKVGEVEKIRSTSMRGRSLIHVEIQDRFFNLDQIWDEVREQIDAAQSELPEGTGTPVLNDDYGDVAVVTAALTSDVFSQAEQMEMAEHIRTAIYGIEGTEKVELLGEQPQRVFIDLPETRMAELGLTPNELAGQLQSRNVMPPAGVIESGEQRFALQVSGEYSDIDALRNAEIQLPDGGTMRLGDLGHVNRGYVDPVEQPAYFNGKRAIVLAISMLDGYSVLDYGHAVKNTLHKVRQTLPAGYDLQIMTFQADQVANAVYGVTSSVIQTLVIVLAVVILFLGVRTGLIVGSIIPAVMLVTLAIMGFMDMTLQRMSLATLVIALGLLVDNAIVIAEDFKTRLENGASRDEALKQTGGELAVPLLSSTLTTILVFLPLMLAEHVSGEYTRSISIVIAISLLTSWFLSLTLTPVLCHRFLKLPEQDAARRRGPGASKEGASKEEASEESASKESLSDRLFRFMASRYESLLRRVLRHRPLFLGIMVLALIGGVGLMQVVPKKFFPDSDRTQVLVYLDFPSDIAPSEADRRIQAISGALNDDQALHEDVSSVAAYAGFGGPRFVLSLTPIDPAPNKGFLVLNVSDRDRVDAVMAETRTVLNRDFPDVYPQITKMFLGPSDSNLLEIQVKGPDREVLFGAAQQVEQALKDLPGSRDVRQSWEARIPTLNIQVDQAQARSAGVTSEDIARSLRGAIDGYHLSNYREGDNIIPIMLRYEEAERSSLQRLKSLTVYPLENPGQGVPLNQVAQVHIGNGYYRIDRENLVRTITIEGRNAGLTAEDMMPRIQPALDRIEADLPPGHWIEFDGVVTQSAEGKAALQAYLPMCLGVIFILLVAQFNSFKRPLLIVTTIPLVIVGVALGLMLMRANFGFMVLLGIYSLAGIIINNAIVLIDRIDIDRRDPALDMTEAVIQASVRRLRPILMATVTTILGFLPLIVGRDALFYGMASAMACGLALGTVMSLGVVPVLYTYFFRGESEKMGAATPENA
ncbi:efflux RND transporter permease subunit [Marinobacter bohaiensis]|uniref:efflux RND transporter permease subunit n=1 Tax=Marinobacter bohaiensis TaxID=2201898 RepID=UPI000DAF064F|nr:efflux RND transporter permease subunit [Marinobacter bohaiensis]